MIITRKNIGVWVRPYDIEGRIITNALSADTEAMTCEVKLKRKLDTDPIVTKTVAISRLAVRSSAPLHVLKIAAELGIEVDRS